MDEEKWNAAQLDAEWAEARVTALLRSLLRRISDAYREAAVNLTLPDCANSPPDAVE